jgi:hypothetical protein
VHSITVPRTVKGAVTPWVQLGTDLNDGAMPDDELDLFAILANQLTASSPRGEIGLTVWLVLVYASARGR